jgi:hypothetical protein
MPASVFEQPAERSTSPATGYQVDIIVPRSWLPLKMEWQNAYFHTIHPYRKSGQRAVAGM